MVVGRAVLKDQNKTKCAVNVNTEMFTWNCLENWERQNRARTLGGRRVINYRINVMVNRCH
jgi:hypothetical protein